MGRSTYGEIAVPDTPVVCCATTGCCGDGNNIMTDDCQLSLLNQGGGTVMISEVVQATTHLSLAMKPATQVF